MRLWYLVGIQQKKTKIKETSNEIIKVLEKRDSEKCEEILVNHVLGFVDYIKEYLSIKD